jgi:hypothetical protein
MRSAVDLYVHSLLFFSAGAQGASQRIKDPTGGVRDFLRTHRQAQEKVPPRAAHATQERALRRKSSLGDAKSSRWVTLRACWVTLRTRWMTLRARWVTLRARWVTLRARWVTLRALAG